MNWINDQLVEKIDREVSMHEKNSVWDSGQFIKIKELSIDSRGKLGKEFVADLLEATGYDIIWNSQTHKKIRQWDFKIDDSYKIEVKTATVGQSSGTFQHERIYKDKDYDILVLLDLTPNSIYLTVAPKSTIPFESELHLRKDRKDEYKWTLKLEDVSSRKIQTVDDVKNRFDYAIKKIKP